MDRYILINGIDYTGLVITKRIQNTVTFTSTYEVDWQNHTVKLIKQFIKKLIPGV